MPGARGNLAGLRPLLRGLQWGAAALVLFDLVLLALRLSPGAAGWLSGERPLGRLFSALVSVAMLALVLLLTRRLDQALAAIEDQTRHRREVLDALPAGVALFDAGARIEFTNAYFDRLYRSLGEHARAGAGYEEMLRAAVAAGIVTEAIGDEEGWIRRRLANFGRSHPGLMRRLPDGRWLRVAELTLPDGRMLAHLVDVSELVAKEQALEEARRDAELARTRLEDAIEALPAGFEMYDADNRLVMVNQANLAMYPQLADLVDPRPTFEQVVRTNHARGGLPQLATAQQLDSWIAEREAQRRSPGPPRVHQVAADIWVRTYERRMRDGGLVAIRLDVSELLRRDAELTALAARLERANDELARLSLTDELTGLANRRAFDARLAEEVGRAARHGLPLALLLADVDHFKPYNDRYGHAAGDAGLRKVAGVLREAAGRSTDLVARVGGEEFALLLPHQGAAEALALAQRCLAALDAAAIVHDASPVAPRLTMSIGVAELQAVGARDPAALYAAADVALYAAKTRGRRRAVVAGS